MNTFTASQAVNKAAADVVTDVSSSGRNVRNAVSLKRVKGLAEMTSHVPTTSTRTSSPGKGQGKPKRAQLGADSSASASRGAAGEGGGGVDRRCRRSAGTGHARLLADARHVTGHVSAGVQQAASTWSFTTCVSVPGGSSAAPYLGSEARSSKPSPFILLTPGAMRQQPCRRRLA